MAASRAALFTEQEIVVDLAGRITQRGDQQRVAHQLGVGQGTLSNILTQGRGIGPDLAERLGFRRVVMFEPIE